MKKPALIAITVILTVAVIGGVIYTKSRSSGMPTPSEEPVVELPVNSIPVAERPFVTLTPDASGRNLALGVDQAVSQDVMEYELVYQAGDKQEGVFGRLDLSLEKQPIEKALLLGSKSGGGKVTYHEGVTGGSLTLTYGTTKLKEQFNFLRFDPTDPLASSPDARFSVEFEKSALAKDSVIVTMKPFGLPAAFPGKLVIGPYSYLVATTPKGTVAVSITLPAGEHLQPTIFEYDPDTGKWTALKTTLKDDTVTAPATVNSRVFLVTTD